MEGFRQWLIEHWPEALSALAALATLAVVLWDRFRPAPFPFEAELRVHRSREFGWIEGQLIFQRPEIGYLAIEELSAKGWHFGVHELDETEPWHPKPTGKATFTPRLLPDWEIGRGASGQGSLALFSFVMTPRASRSSTSAPKVIWLTVRLRFRSARTLHSKIVMISNRLD